MISAPDPIAFSLRPLPTAVAAANATANRPEEEDIRLLALGLGGRLDLYDTAGKRSSGLSNFDPLSTPRDFPYLKPLAGENLGNLWNSLI